MKEMKEMQRSDSTEIERRRKREKLRQEREMERMIKETIGVDETHNEEGKPKPAVVGIQVLSLEKEKDKDLPKGQKRGFKSAFGKPKENTGEIEKIEKKKTDENDEAQFRKSVETSRDDSNQRNIDNVKELNKTSHHDFVEVEETDGVVLDEDDVYDPFAE